MIKKMPSKKINVADAVSAVKNYLLDLQNRICHALEQEDGKAKFAEDPWEHTTGGGGLSRVMAQGEIIEKAGVNFSHVQGLQLPTAATAKRPELAASTFQALGVSTVVHPLNPYIPTSHFNVRFIVVEKEQPIWWFGGGFDLRRIMVSKMIANIGIRLQNKLVIHLDQQFMLIIKNGRINIFICRIDRNLEGLGVYFSMI